MSETFVWPDLAERARPGARALAELRESAAAQGRAQGHAEGLEAGRAAARAEVEEMRVHLRDGLNAVDQAVIRFADLQADRLAVLLRGLCHKLIGHELRTSPDAFEAILGQALARLDGEGTLAEACLHPDDYAVIAPAYHGAVTLHPDPQVAPASVSLRLPEQAADYQPLAIIDELFDTLSEALAQPAAEDADQEPAHDPDD